MTPSSEDTPTIDTTVPEACANCGAVLAADQRYCLNCGDRRSEARLDFIDILSEDAAGRAAAAVLPVAPGPEKTGAEGWVRHNAGILSLVAVVLLAAIGGVVVGKAIDGPDSSASTSTKPPVITVQGAAGSGSGSTSADSAASSDDSSSSASSSTDKAEKGGSGSTKGVQSADQKSSKDIEKSVDKGEPLSTGDGAAPKTDDKAAGGGTDFETIQ